MPLYTCRDTVQLPNNTAGIGENQIRPGLGKIGLPDETRSRTRIRLAREVELRSTRRHVTGGLDLKVFSDISSSLRVGILDNH